jgi:tryptophan 2,3-dioxygenase
VTGEVVSEPTGGTEYSTYLLIDDLLRLQRPLTPEAPDELLFIVVHQAYELWFKLVLFELGRARDALAAGVAQAATGPLRRVLAVTRVLLAQLEVLETLGPEEFLRFRDPLKPASGFQSRQFRAIEALAGEELWPAFCAGARAAGLDMPAGAEAPSRSRRSGALRELYHDHAHPERALLHMAAELLVDLDAAISRWRFHHALMAEREIGSRTGTGGSPGVAYLRSTVERRFFPELWELRSAL